MDMIEPPTILADLGGNIIHLNEEAERTIIGVQKGDNLSRFIDADYISKMTLYNKRMDVVVPKECDYEKAVIKILGSGVLKNVELCFFSAKEYSKDELANDKRLFASYNDIVSRKINGKIKLDDFAVQVVEVLSRDLRFAYRAFEITNRNECGEICTNFVHLSVIAVATIVALNEINCVNPIRIELNRLYDKLIIEISVAENTFVDITGIYALEEAYPHIAMRLMYISSLCQADDIQLDVNIKPNKVGMKFVLDDKIGETGIISAPVFISDIQDASAYALELFASLYTEISEETEEEQE